ncbi:formate/nitrite transporter family protein [Acidaminobacter hydrogenoformans]|uniref:Formate/nitrite transporter n=1 Tax=Acidaminobacter hydrogenoformans DSM 2784 TaxID=1120920 RepID=A0A1G5RWL2_9FIRM|nr:formate/nitrite transporter family protein [Acidaminobacter hydrogenoformans]SCZ78433.1 formate/nitrite transporter [Acidaminobacter hydrogenoformans DSM 2784]
MNEKKMLTPAEIAEATVETAKKKAALSPSSQLLLGVLAGAFIAFAAQGSNMAAFNLFSDPATYGMGKALAGAIFGTGLMLVILAGGELFTGNTLMVAAVMQKKVTVGDMLRNWARVYAGNFVGAMLVTFMIVYSGQLNSSNALLAGQTIKIAAYKVNLPFHSALFLGVMCNWLVTLAVWLSYGAKDMTGKILAIFFPIWLFITSGFEHSIANMYYVPAGILAKANPVWAEASHLSAEVLNTLTWKNFLIGNLLPVTLGNIIGGVVCVGGAYWFVYLRDKKTAKSDPLTTYFKNVA